MGLKHIVMTLVFALAPALLLPAGVQAQTNSRQAIEAARKHRAEQGDAQRAPATPPGDAAPPTQRAGAMPARSGGLKGCMDQAGMNLVARDRCMRQHCEGRWGQGDCPASGGDFTARPGASANTPLGRCLAQAGANPFKRESCGWNHCNGKWDTSAECAAIKPRNKPLAN